MNGIPYRDGYVTLPGRRLHYVDYGGTGDVLVALHGYVQNAHAFDAIAPLLVPSVRLIALDIRGRGESDSGPPMSYRMDNLIRDLRGFVVGLGLSRFSLIGTSMGGTLALLYAMAYPFEVISLVLNDTAVHNNRAGVVRATLRWGQAPARFADISEAIAWFLEERGNLHDLDEGARRAWVGHFLVPDGSGGLRFHCDPLLLYLARQVQQELKTEQQSYRELVWDQARRLTMPVLILRGGESDVLLRDTARRMVAVLPAARCVEVPGVGHSPTLYEPAAQAALGEFFCVAGAHAGASAAVV